MSGFIKNLQSDPRVDIRLWLFISQPSVCVSTCGV